MTPIKVPDEFPNVPCIPVTRTPLFPRFVRIIEVNHDPLRSWRNCVKSLLLQITNPKLLEIVKSRMHLGLPYVGVFLRKDDE